MRRFSLFVMLIASLAFVSAIEANNDGSDRHPTRILIRFSADADKALQTGKKRLPQSVMRIRRPIRQVASTPDRGWFVAEVRPGTNMDRLLERLGSDPGVLGVERDYLRRAPDWIPVTAADLPNPEYLEERGLDDMPDAPEPPEESEPPNDPQVPDEPDLPDPPEDEDDADVQVPEEPETEIDPILPPPPGDPDEPEDPAPAGIGRPAWVYQYALDKLAVYDAWAIERGQPQIIVAVIDSGIDTDHPALRERIWKNPGESENGLDDDGNGFVDDICGWDFYENDAEPQDAAGHGTYVAGVIAAAEDAITRVTGVAEVSLMVLRVLDEERVGTDSDTIRAIEYAVAHGADVINLSLGGTDFSRALRDACQDAIDADVLIVAASGNQGQGAPIYPARFEDVIGVGASDRDDNIASFSNWGTGLDVVAPGVAVISTAEDGNYGYRSGTSIAAPHVSGVAALLRSACPDLDPRGVRQLLIESTDDLGSAGYDTRSAYGRVNAFKALSRCSDYVPPVMQAQEEDQAAATAPPMATGCGLGVFPAIAVLSAGWIGWTGWRRRPTR